MKEKCPFKEKTSFYNIDVNDNTEIDYCNAYKIKCVGEKECPITKKLRTFDKMIARVEKAASKLEEYVKVKASPMHNVFPDIFNMNGYCYKCGNPVFLRKDCKLCRPYKAKAMKIFCKVLGIEKKVIEK